jgi:hypothetical protein
MPTEYITITPNYEQTAAYFATALRDKAFIGDTTEQVISLIEQIRYLTQTDLPAVQRVIERVERGGR